MEFKPPPWPAFPGVQSPGGGGAGSVGIPTVGFLIEPELCGKNERDARDGTKPMVYIWKTLGLLLTFEVRSTTSNSNIVFVDNFWTKNAGEIFWTSICFFCQDAAKHAFANPKRSVKFWPQVTLGLVSLGSDGGRRMPICTSIDATRPVEHSETICIALSRFCEMLQAKNSYHPIWHLITFAKGHWAELFLDHHHWPETCSFWRFRAMHFVVFRICSRNDTNYALNPHSGLTGSWEKCQDYRPSGLGSPNLQKGVKLFKIGILKVSLLSTAFYASCLRKAEGIHPISLATSARVKRSWEITSRCLWWSHTK